MRVRRHVRATRVEKRDGVGRDGVGRERTTDVDIDDELALTLGWLGDSDAVLEAARERPPPLGDSLTELGTYLRARNRRSSTRFERMHRTRAPDAHGRQRHSVPGQGRGGVGAERDARSFTREAGDERRVDGLQHRAAIGHPRRMTSVARSERLLDADALRPWQRVQRRASTVARDVHGHLGGKRSCARHDFSAAPHCHEANYGDRQSEQRVPRNAHASALRAHRTTATPEHQQAHDTEQQRKEIHGSARTDHASATGRRSRWLSAGVICTRTAIARSAHRHVPRTHDGSPVAHLFGVARGVRRCTARETRRQKAVRWTRGRVPETHLRSITCTRRCAALHPAQIDGWAVRTASRANIRSVAHTSARCRTLHSGSTDHVDRATRAGAIAEVRDVAWAGHRAARRAHGKDIGTTSARPVAPIFHVARTNRSAAHDRSEKPIHRATGAHPVARLRCITWP